MDFERDYQVRILSKQVDEVDGFYLLALSNEAT